MEGWKELEKIYINCQLCQWKKAQNWCILQSDDFFFSDAQEEVEFPDADVAAFDYDNNDVDYDEDYGNYDYEEKTYDYELEKPALDFAEEDIEEDLEDLDSIALDEAVTLTLTDGTSTTTTTTTTSTTTTTTTTARPVSQPNVFITLVIGGQSPSGPSPNIEILPSATGRGVQSHRDQSTTKEILPLIFINS